MYPPTLFKCFHKLVPESTAASEDTGTADNNNVAENTEREPDANVTPGK